MDLNELFKREFKKDIITDEELIWIVNDLDNLDFDIYLEDDDEVFIDDGWGHRFEIPVLKYEVLDENTVIHIRTNWLLYSREGLQFLIWLQYKELSKTMPNIGFTIVEDDKTIASIYFISPCNSETYYNMYFSVSEDFEYEHHGNPLDCLFSSIDLVIEHNGRKAELYDTLKDFAKMYGYIIDRFSSKQQSFCGAINNATKWIACEREICRDKKSAGFSLYSFNSVLGFSCGPAPVVRINVINTDEYDCDPPYKRIDYGLWDSTITQEDEELDVHTVISEILHICKKRKRLQIIGLKY